MKIGIDAHSIGSGNSGNETYYRSLLKALNRVDDDNNYVVYGTNELALLDLRINPGQFRISRVSPATPYARIPFAMPFQAKRDRIDVFHAQFIVPPFLTCPVVSTVPDVAFEHYPQFFPAYHVAWSKKLIPWSVRRADHVITVSEFSKRDLVNIYDIDPDKISVTYEAAEQDYFPRDRELAKERIARSYGIERPFVLYVGRIQARKNLPLLIEAFAQVRRGGLAYDLVLAGNSEWNGTPLSERIAELGLSQNVIMTGYVPREDLPWFYNAADVFAYPSFFEGFGLPVMEAMACGTPVVTSKGSSLGEIAAEAALLVDPTDVPAIAAALQQLLSDRGLREQLGRLGIQRSEQFRDERMARETISVYEKVLGNERYTAAARA